MAKALDPICGGQGEIFLQKIVQVDLGLPALPSNMLVGFWEKGVTELIGQETIAELNADGRLLQLWLDGLQCYFRNLRDVTRFLNSFGFMASGFRNEGVWEINVLDLMLVEALRLFDPKVYQVIANHKVQLTGQSENGQSGNLRALAEELVEKRNPVLLTDSQFKDLMRDLFPVLNTSWSNTNFPDANQAVWTREKRVCTGRFFDLYFRLALPSGQLSETVIAGLLALKGDRELLRTEIKRNQENGSLFEIIERLAAEEDFIADPSMAYVLALSDLCDHWGKTPGGVLSSMPGSMYARQATSQLLRSIKDSEARRDSLVRLIRETKGLLIAGVWLDYSTNEEKSRFEWPRIEGETADDLKHEWLERVRASQWTKSFRQIKNLPHLLHLWEKWGDQKEVGDWFAEVPKSELTAFLEGKVSTSTPLSGYAPRTIRWISWKSLAPHGDKGYWREVLRDMEATSDSQEAESVVPLLRDAIQRWEQGKDDSDSWNFRDDNS